MPNFRYMDSEEPQDEEDYVDEDLSDVENRLEEANCYKALLQSPLFGDDSPEVAERVEKKVKEFIRKELGILLGLEARASVVVPESLFDENEVALLKTWAGVLKGRPYLMNGKSSSEPEVNKATVQRAPEVSAASVAKPIAIVKPVKAEKPKQTRSRKPKAEPKETDPDTIVRQVPVNGEMVEVKMNVKRQTRPAAGTPGYIMPLDPEASAMYAERNALTNPPTGIIALASEYAATHGE